MKKIQKLALLTFGFAFFSLASAHVVVKPDSVNIGAFQTFDMGVPTEKDIPTIALKLLVPPGLAEVSPNVKPGWYITEKKTGDEVTEIDWVGGNIPVNERDDFYFSAQAPATSTTLLWKAYQTYADGSIVSWDADPSAIPAGEEGTPYSKTQVIDDLSDSKPAAPVTDKTALTLSIVALALSLATFFKTRTSN